MTTCLSNGSQWSPLKHDVGQCDIKFHFRSNWVDHSQLWLMDPHSRNHLAPEPVKAKTMTCHFDNLRLTCRLLWENCSEPEELRAWNPCQKKSHKSGTSLEFLNISSNYDALKAEAIAPQVMHPNRDMQCTNYLSMVSLL